LGAAASRPAASHSQIIDFDLDSELVKAAPAAAPAATDKADFDLSHFDFSGEPSHPAGSGEGTVEFNLDELDLSKPAGGGSGLSSGDEIGTKLDLARVYADMGDNDAARGLLSEVLATGNAAQKAEAEALIKRLSV
jgi:pilus assembly protein FimV